MTLRLLAIDYRRSWSGCDGFDQKPWPTVIQHGGDLMGFGNQGIDGLRQQFGAQTRFMPNPLRIQASP